VRQVDYKTTIGNENIELMADKAMVYGEFGNFKALNKEDVTAILTASL
jgi:alcohol dehydrogenase YqhD (iron-dependent ADH family)